MAARRTLSTFILLCFLWTPLSHAQEASTGFLKKVFKSAAGESKYVLFVPQDYKGDKEYPLILFLHGAGERGDDGELPVKQGIGNAIKFKGKEAKFPFLVIFPQAKIKGSWKAEDPDAQGALAILAEVQKTHKVDAKRLYLTGLSMGGSGTWSLAAAYPHKWAAIAPICGRPDPATAETIKHIPCWSFVGDKDAAKLVDSTREMTKVLQKINPEFRYTEFPFVGHNSWDPAYVMDELYTWFLKHQAK